MMSWLQTTRILLRDLHSEPRRSGVRSKRARRPGITLRTEQLEDRVVLNAGGGFTGGGILGQYYANVTNPTDWLNNTANYSPTFTRTDVRINFNWNTGMANAVSGLNAVAFPDTNFATKWTGTIIPKYSESYQFSTLSDDGVRLVVNGQTLINDWSYHGATTDTGSITLTAGQSYSVEMDYFQGGGGATAELLWSSPSTPQEVMEPATPLGVNTGTNGQFFADAMASADNAYYGLSASNGVPASTWSAGSVDPNGWPLQDTALYLMRGEQQNNGTYLLTFTGKAAVFAWNATFYSPANPNHTQYSSDLSPDSATYNVNGTPLASWLTGNIDSSIYNATTNTTTVAVVWGGGDLNLFLMGTQRNDGSGLRGVTNIHMMRPTTPGGTTDYAAGTMFTSQSLGLMSQFSGLRFMDWTDTNGNFEANWSEQQLPGYNGNGNEMWSSRSNGGPWEAAIAFANATGKDAWISIPVNATNDYITKLADLFAFGADANGNPYTSAQANPVWLPLNPNLHLYMEYGNEVWGFGGEINAAKKLAVEAIYDATHPGANDPNAAAYNSIANGTFLTSTGYGITQVSSGGEWTAPDGTQWSSNAPRSNGPGYYYYNDAWASTREFDVSNLFRSVFGNGAMPATSGDPRIRPVLEWQAVWPAGSEGAILQQLWGYYDNGVGNYVSNPQPVNYYLWGGGGTWYTGPNDNFGTGDVAVTNGSFENGSTGWTFSGTSGIAANGNTTLNPPNTPYGSNAAYVTGTGSFSTTVTVPSGDAGYADIYFYAGYTGSGDTFKVLVDGTQIGTFTPGQDAGNPAWAPTFQLGVEGQFTSDYEHSAPEPWMGLHTGTLLLTAGTHTIQFVGTGSGSSFIDNVQVGTVNGIYNSGLSNVISSDGITMDVDLTRAYGLHYASYEGGFTVGGYWKMPALWIDANSDPRAGTFNTQSIDQLYQYTGPDTMANAFADVGGDWGLAYPTVYNQNTPKLQGLATVEAGLPPATIYGTPAGQTASLNSWLTPGQRIDHTFLVTIGGNFNATFSIATDSSNSSTTEPVELLLDGNIIGTFNVNSQAGGSFSVAVQLAAGQHSLSLVYHAGSGNWLSNPTETLVAVTQSPPAAPTNLSASAGNTQVSLSWTASSGAASYNIYRGTGSGGETLVHSGVTATSFTDTGLTNGTKYYYEVTAVNNGGESGRSSEVSAMPEPPAPAAPTNLSPTPGNAQVSLAWTASSGAASYNIYRGTASGGEIVVHSGITTTSYTDAGLTNGTIYYYEVTAVNGGGQSGMSNQVSATPQAPANGPSMPSVGQPVFFDNFKSGSLGSSWTTVGGPWAVSGGTLNSSGGGDPVKAIIANTGQTFDPNNTEVLARVKVTSISGDGRAGVSLDNKGSGLGYNLVFHGSMNTVQFLDDFVQWGPAYSFSAGQLNTWYWFRFAVSSGTLYGKIWQDGTAEPTSWMYTYSPGWSAPGGNPAVNAGSGAAASFDHVSVVEVPVSPVPMGQPLYWDNFNGPALSSAWTTHSGTWSVSNNVAKQTNTSGDPIKAILTDQTYAANTTSILAEVNVSAIGGDARAGVSLYTNASTGMGYNLVFHGNMGTVQFLDDYVQWSPAYSFAGGQLNTWYWFRFTVSNSTLYGKIWADGTAEPTGWMYQYTPGSNWNLTGGAPALNAGSGATASFRDVIVIDPAAPVSGGAGNAGDLGIVGQGKGDIQVHGANETVTSTDSGSAAITDTDTWTAGDNRPFHIDVHGFPLKRGNPGKSISLGDDAEELLFAMSRG